MRDLTLFTQALAAEAGGDEVRAAAIKSELFAASLDFDRLADGFEAEAAGDAVVEEVEV
jgi:hypothetical protein